MSHFGFDLDNTLIDYSNSSYIYSVNSALPEVHSLNELRNLLKPDDNEYESWTKAQSWIYGEGLEYAKVSTNALQLINRLKENGWHVSVISHKTEFGPQNFGTVPFRKHAINWLKQSALSDYFTSPGNIWFSETLQGKIELISELRPDFYVDDLPKVFMHPKYPKSIVSYLYRSKSDALPWVKLIDDFKDIDVKF